MWYGPAPHGFSGGISGVRAQPQGAGQQITAADARERGENSYYVQACLAWKARAVMVERR